MYFSLPCAAGRLLFLCKETTTSPSISLKTTTAQSHHIPKDYHGTVPANAYPKSSCDVAIYWLILYRDWYNKSAVSLLKSREQHYIKAININNNNKVPQGKAAQGYAAVQGRLCPDSRESAVPLTADPALETSQPETVGNTTWCCNLLRSENSMSSEKAGNKP